MLPRFYTQEVERGFATCMDIRGGQWDDQHVPREEDILIVKLTDPKDLPALSKAAGKLWLANYGKPRHHTQRRVDAGIPKGCRSTGEAAFLQAVGQIQKALPIDLGDALPSRSDLVDIDNFNEKQCKEMLFNLKKVDRAKVEALLSGVMLEEEVTGELIGKATEHTTNIAKKPTSEEQREYTQTFAAQEGPTSSRGRPCILSWANRHVFCCSAVQVKSQESSGQSRG